ncbi:WD40 repeat domain-containing protein [Acrocarpospora phusangensis]|nr:hypothetical protein [Acrocarpospora phusangensis]
MKKIRILVALAAVLAAVPGAQGTALAEQKHQRGHGDSVRYASAKACVKKDGSIVPCGTWRLVTHHGKVILLRDAQLRALDQKGKPMTEATAPVAVSGDGQKIAYFRKDGRLAVRTLHGEVRLLPKDTLPARTAQHDVTLQLSDDGAVLAVAVSPGTTQLFATASATRLGRLAEDRYLLGFSGDGDQVLTGATGTDGSLGVHDLSGRVLRQVTLPDSVAYGGPYALHADGTTIASLVSSRKIAVYDLLSGKVTGNRRIKLLPRHGTVHKLDWTGAKQLTLHVSQHFEKAPTKVTVLRHDVKSATTEVRDTYDVLRDTFVYATCGG